MSGVKAIWIPYYQCDTVRELLLKHSAKVKFYHTDNDWNPTDLDAKKDESCLFVKLPISIIHLFLYRF